MSEQKNYEFPTLEPDDIEVKVKQVGKNGTVVLLYKTSRTDMRYLDEVYGVNNWQVDYQMIGDSLYCTISIWDDEKKQWVRKQSNGIPSREDGEGNEVKGQASDAMKRAGFVAGCGRELYTAPFTFISSSKLPTKQDPRNDKRWVLEDPFTKFAVSDIGYDSKRKINRLVIINQSTGEVLYQYGGNNNRTSDPKKTSSKPSTKKEEPKKEDTQKEEQGTFTRPTEKTNATVETVNKLPNSNEPEYKKLLNGFLERHKIDDKKFISMRADAFKAGKGVTDKKFKELTEDEWITLLAIMEALCEEGFFKDVA